MLVSSDGLYKKIIGSRIIGIGSTAIAFKTRDNKTLKYYLNTERKKYIFQNNDMLNNLDKLSQLKIKNIYTPQKIYVNESKVVAYDYEYIAGSSLRKKVPDISLELFVEYLDELYENICILSEHKIYSRDFHGDNVIINNKGINIFDLDQYDYSMFPEDVCLRHNLDVIFHQILYYVFLLEENVVYQDQELGKLVTNFLSILGTFEGDMALLEYIRYMFKGKEISIKNLSKEIKKMVIK